MNALAFRNVTFDVKKINNQIYITSAQLAQALGYAEDRSVSNIYTRNQDEFTDAMSVVINLSTTANLKADTRVFNLRGCHLIAMFAKTPVAKDFRKWALDVLDKELNPQFEVKRYDYQRGRQEIDSLRDWAMSSLEGKNRERVLEHCRESEKVLVRGWTEIDEAKNHLVIAVAMLRRWSLSWGNAAPLQR